MHNRCTERIFINSLEKIWVLWYNSVVMLNTNKIKEKSAPKSYIFEIVGLIFSKF